MFRFLGTIVLRNIIDLKFVRETKAMVTLPV